MAEGGGKSGGGGGGLMIALAMIVGGVLVLGVPICGILAAIAIPNFLKFQCKSKQSEAKTNLSGIFTAEKAFYGEYGFYSSDLVSINWQPDGAPLYLYGFRDAGPDDLSDSDIAPIAGYDDERKDTSNPAVAGTSSFTDVKMRDITGTPLSPGDLPESFVDRDHFVAAAIGDIDTDGTGVELDVWTIDEQRQLRVLENDCTH